MATNAIETAKQENGSLVYFQLYIESAVPPKYEVLLKAVQKVYRNVPDDWMQSYGKQAAALKSYLKTNKGYSYSRDSGFMPFIEGVAKAKCGVSIKDRWNPADIYMVKRSKESAIRNKISKITNSTDRDKNLQLLNEYMRELVLSKDMLPISLKAIKKTTPSAQIDLANVGNGISKKFSIVTGSVKCLLSFGNKSVNEFDTGEFAFDFIAGNEMVHGQSRNFQYSVPRNLVQTDLTPKGRSAGAKLGKVSSSALDTFLNNNGLKRPASASSDSNIPSVGNWKKSDIEYWVDFFNKIKNVKVGGAPIDFGSIVATNDKGKTVSGIEGVLKTAIGAEEKTRSSAGRFSSKLIGLRWVYVWGQIEKKGLMDEWLQTLYYGAKKEFGDKNGPFVKIY